MEWVRGNTGGQKTDEKVLNGPLGERGKFASREYIRLIGHFLVPILNLKRAQLAQLCSFSQGKAQSRWIVEVELVACAGE